MDAFYYHNTPFCMTCLHGKTLGVLIILAQTIYQFWCRLFFSHTQKISLVFFFAIDCRITKKGVFYQGTASTTLAGYTCQRWDSQSPHRHPVTSDRYFADGDVSKAKNYCRTPRYADEVLADHPWCFTTDVNKRFEYCDISYCGESCEHV